MPTPLLSPASAPPAAPQRGGLLASALAGDTSTDWFRGVMEWPEGPPGWELSLDCSTETVEVGDQEGALQPLSGVPYVIRTHVRCPYHDIAEMARRARARLDAITSRAIARELMLGEITTADPYELSDAWDWLNTSPSAGEFVNPYLTDTAGDVLDPILDPLAALGAVEAEVGSRIVTGPVYLHVPVSLVDTLGLALIERGDLIMTRTGGIVVADYGNPLTEVPTIYGTGPVQVWTGDPWVDDLAAEVLDRDTNEINVYAQRAALALFDPRTLVSIEVTEP